MTDVPTTGIPRATASVEQRLIAAFSDARTTIHENPDLFSRVTRSVAEAAERRRWRWRIAFEITSFVVALGALGFVLSDIDNGRFTMPWWVIELLTNIVLIALAVCLGPFIKRFGRSYAADVFRANPRTGKSYLVLTDVAYYLIFASFVLFTVTFVEPVAWKVSTGAQLKDEVSRIGGILLIMGILHALNVVALPVIGRLLSMNKRLDDGDGEPPSGMPTGPAGTSPIGPGTWILHVAPMSGPEGGEPAN